MDYSITFSNAILLLILVQLTSPVGLQFILLHLSTEPVIIIRCAFSLGCFVYAFGTTFKDKEK